MTQESAKREGEAVSTVKLRRLTPDTARVYEATFGLLHCEVRNDTLYRGVFAILLFPISHPDRYVSLHHIGPDDKVEEIGIIEDLRAFPPNQQDLIRRALAKHYHERVICRILGIENKHGLLFFDVETQLGREQFVVPWKQDRAEPYGTKGKVILDALDNRYVVPDISALPPADQHRFTMYIYW